MVRLEQTRRPRRSRLPDPRTLALAVAVAAFTVAMLWVSDSLARVGAQSLIARAVQQGIGTPNRPSVHVHDRSFLLEVIRGRYADVDITAAPVVSGPLRIAEVHAVLHGVRLSLHDVLVRDTHRIVIDRSAETATFHYGDLNRYFAATANPLKVAFARKGEVRLTGTVRVLGTSVSASADARLSFVAGALAITPTQFDLGSSGLDQASRVLLGQRFTVRIPLQALPFGQSVTRIDVARSGILVHASGRNLVITN